MIKTNREYTRMERHFFVCQNKKLLLETKPLKDQALLAQIKELENEIEKSHSLMQSYRDLWSLGLRPSKMLAVTKSIVLDFEQIINFPSLLIQARLILRLNHQQLADKLQISKRQLHRWETSIYSGASMSTVIRISQILKQELINSLDTPQNSF